MKNIIKLTSLVALLFVSSFSFAQKFGHINSQELLAVFPESEVAQNEIDEYAKKLEEQLEKQQVEYNNKLNDYIQQRKGMTDFLKQSSEEELSNMQQRMQAYQKNAQQELKNKEAQLIQPLLKNANDAIKAVGERDKFVYIFDKASGAVIFEGVGSKDLTEDILTEIYKADADKKAKAFANLEKLRQQVKEGTVPTNE